MKRAAIYARVSTEEQAERGWSLSSQVEACQKFAEQRGLSIIDIFQDDISGATPIQERPEGKRLQKMVNSREIDTVIVYQVDRLSRRLGDLIYTVEDWLRNRLDIFSLDTGQIKSENDIVLVIRGWQGTDERAKIRERTMRGKREKAKNGKIVMIGHPPFGYLRNGRGDEARLVIEEREAATVRKIFHWYIKGNGINGPLSLRAIAERLDNEGDPTPHYRSNAAERWIPATVRGILVNEIYAGRTYYEKTRIIDPGKHLREKVSPENWIPINAPELAIIDRPLFEMVQDRARRNQEQARRNQKREYLMTGHFRCGACNSAMAGTASRPNGYITIYYRCGNHFREEKCPNAGKTIVTSKVDAVVWDWIKYLLSDDQALIDGIRAMRERSETEIEPKQARLEHLEELIQQRETKIRRLASQLGDTDEETVIDAIKSEMRQQAKERDSLAIERQSLTAELSQVQISPELETEVLRIAAELREELGEADYETKRYLLDKLNFEAVFQDQNGERWLDVKCGIVPEWIMLRLSSGSSRH